MASHALQIVPAGARHVGGNVYQLPRRRSSRGGVGKHHKKKTGSRHSFFSRQWVWYALALMLADAVGTLILAEVAPWISVPALVLYFYGVWKKKPGAKNAAYAIQGAHMLAYWGITGMVRGLAQQHVGGGKGFFGISAPAGGGAGGKEGNYVAPAQNYAPPSGGAGNTSTDVNNAVALLGALNNAGVV